MKLGQIQADINDFWVVAHDSEELTEAVTNYTIDGLDGDTDTEYQLIWRVRGASAVAMVIRIRPNNDTGSNHGYQYMLGRDTAASANKGITTGFFLSSSIAQNALEFASVNIQAKSGKVRTAISNSASNISTTTVTDVMKFGNSWNNTADNITSLVLASSQASGIGIGSRFVLLKKVHATDGMKTGEITPNKIVGAWERIYNDTLSAPATSVTISNLTGDTDCIYRLIYRLKIGVNDTDLYLRLGYNDSIDTNSRYGSQELTGENLAVVARRDATTLWYGSLSSNHQDQNELIMGDLLLYAKSGYVRTGLLEFAGGITGTTVTDMGIKGFSYNQTGDEITDIQLLTDQTNGLAINSHVELYRLNL